MSVEHYTAPVLAIIRSAEGPERRDYERIWTQYESGLIDISELDAQTDQVRAQVLLREGPHKRPFPRNEHTESYCEMRNAVREGVHLDAAARYAGGKGRPQYERWLHGVLDAFDTRADLIRALWCRGRRDDIHAYNELLAQGDQMQSFYRGLHVPWWPRHIGDSYASVLEAWGELRQQFSPVSGWGVA